MNPLVKKQWVDALRSNQYEQGTDCLRSGKDKFCCLGVLCDLAVKAGVIPEPEFVMYNYEDPSRYRYDRSETLLPSKVASWAELDVDPEILIDDEFGRSSETLTELNDGKHYPFNKIADLIEEQL
jgi:hypothetical protein